MPARGQLSRSRSTLATFRAGCCTHRIQIPCQPGKLKLWYPKWVPGTHGPYGPVQNVGGLIIQTSDGKRLKWQRDELELFRVECDVPEGVREVTVLLDTICNEPAEQASGHLTYGNNLVGIINWGTCMIYPEGFSCDDIQASLTLRLPAKWQFAIGAQERGNQRRPRHVSDGISHGPG